MSTSGAFLWRGDYECIKRLYPEEYDYDSNTNSHQVAYDGPSFTKVNIFREKSFDIEGVKYAYNAYYAENYIYHIVMFSRVSIDQDGDYRSEQGEICICGNHHFPDPVSAESGDRGDQSVHGALPVIQLMMDCFFQLLQIMVSDFIVGIAFFYYMIYTTVEQLLRILKAVPIFTGSFPEYHEV